MKWLLWKDYRHNKMVVLMALALLLLPHFVALCAIVTAKLRGSTVEFEEVGTSLGYVTGVRWRAYFAASSNYSLFLSQVAVALVGGNSIAGERLDRSAEFLASLPITRRRILCSKILLAIAITAVLWSVNTTLLWYLRGSLPTRPDLTLSELLANAAITGLTFFGVAWSLSACIASPTFAVAGGLVTPLLVIISLSYASDFVPFPRRDWFEPCYRDVCVSLAIVAFAVGTWHYLRRVEP
jgi:ABC-type transport system involved in multi-copper enzyme maturation permease subunit